MAKRLLCVLLSVLMVVAMLPMGVVADEEMVLIDTEDGGSSNSIQCFTSSIKNVRTALANGGYIEVDASSTAESGSGSWFQVGVINSEWTWETNASSTTWVNGGESVTITVTSVEIGAVSDFNDAWKGIYVQGASTLEIAKVRVYGPEEEEAEYVYTFTSSGNLGFYITDYISGYSEGDTVIVTATLESDGYFNGGLGASASSGWVNYNGGNGFESSDGSSITAVFEYTVGSGTYGELQVWYMSGTYVNLTAFTIEYVAASTSTTASFYTRTLSLGTKIGINYYVDFTDVEDPSGYYVVFTPSVGSPQTVTYAKATTGVMSTTTDLVKFDCRLDCWNMGATVKAELYNSEGVVQTDDMNYSISTYATNVAGSTTLDNLLSAMMTYGHYAYVKKGSGVDVNTYTDLSSATVDASAYAADVVENTESISVTASLSLTDSVAINFTVPSGYTMYIDDVATTSISDILVQDWGETLSITVANDSTGDGVYEANYSVLSYVNYVINNSTDTDLVNLAKAMYNYYVAVVAYVG